MLLGQIYYLGLNFQAIQEGRSPEPYQPTWFTRKPDNENGGKYIFVYHGGYWENKKAQTWSDCPDIY